MALKACCRDAERGSEAERERRSYTEGENTAAYKARSDRSVTALSAAFFCERTDLPFTFGKVFLDLSADRFVDVLVQSCVSRDPVTLAGLWIFFFFYI